MNTEVIKIKAANAVLITKAIGINVGLVVLGIPTILVNWVGRGGQYVSNFLVSKTEDFTEYVCGITEGKMDAYNEAAVNNDHKVKVIKATAALDAAKYRLDAAQGELFAARLDFAAAEAKATGLGIEVEQD